MSFAPLPALTLFTFSAGAGAGAEAEAEAGAGEDMAGAGEGVEASLASSALSANALLRSASALAPPPKLPIPPPTPDPEAADPGPGRRLYSPAGASHAWTMCRRVARVYTWFATTEMYGLYDVGVGVEVSVGVDVSVRVWNVPDNRREPILKRKRLASVASEETAVGGGFEETEVDPGDKEAELDEYKGGGAEEDDEDVGDEEVDAGEGLKWQSWIEKVDRKSGQKKSTSQRHGQMMQTIPTLTRSLILPKSWTWCSGISWVNATRKPTWSPDSPW